MSMIWSSRVMILSTLHLWSRVSGSNSWSCLIWVLSVTCLVSRSHPPLWYFPLSGEVHSGHPFSCCSHWSLHYWYSYGAWCSPTTYCWCTTSWSHSLSSASWEPCLSWNHPSWHFSFYSYLESICLSSYT
jgi:hypothetical protein